MYCVGCYVYSDVTLPTVESTVYLVLLWTQRAWIKCVCVCVCVCTPSLPFFIACSIWHIAYFFDTNSFSGGFPDSYTLQVKPTILDWTSPGVITMPNISALSTGTTRHMSVSKDVAGLIPLTAHDARVLSINFNGASNYSEEARFSTVGKCV